MSMEPKITSFRTMMLPLRATTVAIRAIQIPQMDLGAIQRIPTLAGTIATSTIATSTIATNCLQLRDPIVLIT